MDVMTTHGAFSWSELTTTDPAAAASFYGALFGWSVEEMDVEGLRYSVAKVGDTMVAGLMGQPPGTPPMPPRWGSYVTVDDVDVAAKRVTELGGALLAEPRDIPNIGRFAICEDPQGAMFHIIAYKQNTGGA